ncbi:hypothetical protein NDU88_009701 [Pleurodeles waltl]|uniref:Cyclic nucleotide-binding domain-containing protein n=1 Tax=Pleurodeles waltl TaxID=8319 RepID=A0AAV7QVA5_PLEWA|nr:hypothetical protein NDU88_009701 [Pleurodeles waltl]
MRASPVRAERQLRKMAVGAHERRRQRVVGSRTQQAQLALESEGSAPAALNERTLGGAANMAASSGFSVISKAREDLQSGVDREVGRDTVCEDVVIVLDSDDDLETGNDFYDEGCSQRHRVEDRVQPGAVRLTLREVPVSGEGSSASNAGGLRSFPASQGALSGLTGEEEALDYEEEDTSRPTTVTKTSSNKKAVPGDRLAGGENVLSSNLSRGEVTNTLGAFGAVSGKKVVGDNLNNVDVAIQVEDVGVQGGKMGSLSGAIDAVSCKQDLTQGLLNVIQNSRLLGQMHPGTAFGELAILYNCKRTATVKGKMRFIRPVCT